MRFRRRRAFSRSRGGTSLRWVASSALQSNAVTTVVEGSASSFDLTPGAPSAHWQTGTTEPTLLRIRGHWLPLVRGSSTIVLPTDNGVVTMRQAAILIYWAQQGLPTLDPFSSVDLANDGVLFHDYFAFQIRDYIVPTGGAPANNDMQLPSFASNITRPIDIKARRRVRNENDRLMISVRFHEWSFNQGSGFTAGNAGGLLTWMLRFLYRTHR